MNTVLGTELRMQHKYRLNLNLELECFGSDYIIKVTLKSTFNFDSDSTYVKWGNTYQQYFCENYWSKTVQIIADV